MGPEAGSIHPILCPSHCSEGCFKAAGSPCAVHPQETCLDPKKRKLRLLWAQFEDICSNRLCYLPEMLLNVVTVGIRQADWVGSLKGPKVKTGAPRVSWALIVTVLPDGSVAPKNEQNFWSPDGKFYKCCLQIIVNPTLA